VVKKALTKAALKSEVISRVEQQGQELIKLSLNIHANPELGFEEKRASAWLTDYLDGNSFQVENGVGGLATAFKAVYGSFLVVKCLC